MKPIIKQYEYYRMKMIQSEFLLEFESLKEMVRYVEKNNLKSIFILPASQEAPERFAFSNKGGLLQYQTDGYLSLEDFKHSELNGFPDATTFYNARKLEFDKYDEYKMSTETGITDARDYEEIKKGGFIEAFKELEKERANNDELPRLEEITNANELKEWITKKKFENITEFMNAWKKGFTSPPEFREATTKEFKNYHDYKKGEDNGFNFGLDFYKAAENGIEDFAEYTLFLDINALEYPEATTDQKLMFVILSKVIDGKRISVNKLTENLNEEKKIYQRKDGTMPPWFKIVLNSTQDIVNFISTNEAVRKYGIYEAEGEFFQKKKTNDRTIILDGSNVAFGKTGDNTGKPLMKNILTMVNFLKEKGFTDIYVFTDISIKKRIPDMDLLEQVKELCKFSYTPADKPADMFLIQYVKQNHCLIVSNDKFRDWKMQDTWVSLNIDYYRYAFVIQDDKVLMPDLDK